MEQAPRDLGNLLVTWSPEVLKGGRAALEWSALGKYYLDPANVRSTSGYSLVNAHFNYNVLPNVEVFARAINVLDRKYAELASFDAFQGEQITAASPRSIFLGMRYGWQK
jgi:outer membrane receptor protein involved in Fe transport